MLKLSIFAGKALLALLRLSGRRGSALPGLVIEKFDKTFLNKTLGKLPRGVVLVTGTNGKTTTTKILTSLLEAQGLRVLTNETGSNFVRGIIATTLEKIKLSGKLEYDIAVIEQDEAYAVHFVAYVKPVGLVALNVMRDQMDRFGEIDTTAKLIAKTADSVTDWLVLNANDPRVASLSSGRSNLEINWFGHDRKLISHFVSDDQHYSGEKTKFTQAEEPTSCLVAASKDGLRIKLKDKIYNFQPKLEGAHNALNITAALAALDLIVPNYKPDKLQLALENIMPAFGRGEQIELKNGGILHLQLVKNPSGFTHSLRLLDDRQFNQIAIAINDDYADGRDVSWLWDVDFDSVLRHGAPTICGGVRGYDMALRLKYENAKLDGVLTDNAAFLEAVLKSVEAKGHVIVFCTYTAMLQLRKLLKKQSLQMNEEGL